MNQIPEPKLKSLWKEGSRVWKVVDTTILAEEPYYHLKLVKGRHSMPTRVVYDIWFLEKVEIHPSQA